MALVHHAECMMIDKFPALWPILKGLLSYRVSLLGLKKPHAFTNQKLFSSKRGAIFRRVFNFPCLIHFSAQYFRKNVKHV